MLPGETAETAAARAVGEELGTAWRPPPPPGAGPAAEAGAAASVARGEKQPAHIDVGAAATGASEEAAAGAAAALRVRDGSLRVERQVIQSPSYPGIFFGGGVRGLLAF